MRKQCVRTRHSLCARRRTICATLLRVLDAARRPLQAAGRSCAWQRMDELLTRDTAPRSTDCRCEALLVCTAARRSACQGASTNGSNIVSRHNCGVTLRSLSGKLGKQGQVWAEIDQRWPGHASMFAQGRPVDSKWGHVSPISTDPGRCGWIQHALGHRPPGWTCVVAPRGGTV